MAEQEKFVFMCWALTSGPNDGSVVVARGPEEAASIFAIGHVKIADRIRPPGVRSSTCQVAVTLRDGFGSVSVWNVRLQAETEMVHRGAS